MRDEREAMFERAEHRAEDILNDPELQPLDEHLGELLQTAICLFVVCLTNLEDRAAREMALHRVLRGVRRVAASVESDYPPPDVVRLQ